MPVCEMCGNEYDKSFQVVDAAGEDHIFDSFECAISVLAPVCAHCGCRIVGHGTEAGDEMFCCAHCAQQHGVGVIRDRA